MKERQRTLLFAVGVCSCSNGGERSPSSSSSWGVRRCRTETKKKLLKRSSSSSSSHGRRGTPDCHSGSYYTAPCHLRPRHRNHTLLSLSPPLPKFPNPPLAQTHSKHIPHLSWFSFVSFLFFRFLFSFCLFLFSLFLFFFLLVLLFDEKFLYSFFFGSPAAEAKVWKDVFCGAMGNAQDRYKLLLCNFTGAKNSRM